MINTLKLLDVKYKTLQNKQKLIMKNLQKLKTLIMMKFYIIVYLNSIKQLNSNMKKY